VLVVNCCSAPAFSQSSSLSLPYAFSQSQTTVKMVNFAFPLLPSAWLRRSRLPLRRAPPQAKDAAACVDDLARKGRNGVNCVVGENEFAIQQCRIGGVQITSTKSDSSRQSVNCNEVARTAGLIFDSCFRADNTVKGSEIISSNRKLQVNIRHA